MLAGCGNVSDPVRAVATGVADLVDQHVAGGLLAGAGLADDVVVLARTRQVADSQLARRLQCARTHNDLATDAATVLKAEQWHSAEATSFRIAAEFRDQQPTIAAMWDIGELNTIKVATIARMTRDLPESETTDIIETAAPYLSGFSVPMIKPLLQHAIELLHPTDANDAEQTAGGTPATKSIGGDRHRLPTRGRQPRCSTPQ